MREATLLQPAIREAEIADAARIYRYISAIADEPHNGILVQSAKELWSVEEHEGHLRRALYALNRLVLIAEADDAIIGMADVNPAGSHPGFQHTLSLGITVSLDWRNQGIGTMLIEHIIEWCRANPYVLRLELEVFNNNPRAARLYERLGFQHEGTRHRAFLKHGEFLDLIRMGMLFQRGLLVRRFDPEDATACSDVINACVPVLSGLNDAARFSLLSQNIPSELVADFAQGEAYVAEWHGQVVGLGSLRGNVIRRMYVMPDVQGRGIGRALLRALESEAYLQGASEVSLESSLNAVPFYERQGYIRVESSRAKNGEAIFQNVQMVKHLPIIS